MEHSSAGTAEKHDVFEPGSQVSRPVRIRASMQKNGAECEKTDSVNLMQSELKDAANLPRNETSDAVNLTQSDTMESMKLVQREREM